ncbi:MAG: helix-turn-helix domain-containing protein [Actinomycetota bacterium]
MARPREFDLDTATAKVADVFWQQGFEATTISDLEHATGLARARLYAAFGDKREMLHRSIGHYLHGPLETVVRRVDDGGLDGIVGWFAAIADLRRDRPERALMGCLVVNSLVELGDSDPAVNELGEQYRTRLRAAFAGALADATAHGDIDGDIERRAEVALLLLYGIFVTIRSGTDEADVRAAVDAAVSVVDSWRR